MADEPTHVIDACALIALFKKEPGYEPVRDILKDERNVPVIHGVNLCEVYYDYLKADTPEIAGQAWMQATQLVRLVSPMEESFLKTVGHWKTQYRLPLGDAFAAALAAQHSCPIVTKDHGDFDGISSQHALTVIWCG